MLVYLTKIKVITVNNFHVKLFFHLSLITSNFKMRLLYLTRTIREQVKLDLSGFFFFHLT